GSLVRLRDVARIELGALQYSSSAFFGKDPTVVLAVYQMPGSNALDLQQRVKDKMQELSQRFPKGVHYAMHYDTTRFVSASMHDVLITLGEALVLVVAVVFIFLQSWRTTIIPTIAIPVSLIATLAIMYMLGFSLNMLSLLGMVLAIGLVVDDAIVVVENIHRHMEEDHMSPMQAAFNGMREIATAIVAMTITLAAVFAPLAFTGGLTGALFREFAVTLAGSVVLSGLIAMTITPMMSARLLKAGQHGRFQRIVDGTFSRVERVYERAVTASLRNRPVTLIIVVALVALTGFMFTKTSTELAPEEDQGFLLSLVTAPRYATSDYTETYVNQMLGLVRDIPETRAQFSAVAFGGATNSAFVGFAFKDWADRKRNSKELQADITARLAK
ncbi:MAG: efflux RND transporter permease subunit, partial [Mesorhizobium sp.]